MPVKIKRGDAAGLVNLTPMIDVVFQLLLFFIVVSKFSEAERHIKMQLPQASEAKPLTVKPKEFFINIDKDGHHFAAGTAVSLRQLEQTLQQLAANNPGRQSVIIRADRRSQLEATVSAVNACQKAKIQDYTVTTANPGQTGSQ